MYKNEEIGAKILHGDCIEKMKEFDENSIDAVVTDPPYFLGTDLTIDKEKLLKQDKLDKGGFMGKSWDGGDVEIVEKDDVPEELIDDG